jgi:hypothetical protein
VIRRSAVGDVIYRLRHASGRVTVPPMIKLALLVALGLVPFVVFALLQSDGELTGEPDEPSTQPISNERVPLAFPFGTPEPPSTAPAADSTTTTSRVRSAVAQCADGKDNDLDRRVDLADSGCSSRQDNNEAQAVTTTRRLAPVTTTAPPPPTQPPTTAPPPPTTPPPPPSSTAPPPPTQPPSTALRNQGECSDGRDNDRDGDTDLADRASCHGDPTEDE